MDMAAVTAEARARVAAGTAGSVESGIWSVTYQAGYTDGRAHAWHGSGAWPSDAKPEGYRAGFARGYAWGVAHPLPAFRRDGRHVNEATARQVVAGHHGNTDASAAQRAADSAALDGWYPVMLGDSGAWVGRVRDDRTAPFFVRYGV